MRVVFLEDVTGVAQGGEVKEVKPGFARNYLIPKRLATPVTTDALQRVKRLKRQAEETRVKVLTDMRALSEQMSGTRVNVEMRTGASGRLYGSVTNAIVAAELSKMTGREIDRRTIELGDSIREVGTYDVRLRLHADVEANISLLVHPMGTDPAEFLASLEEKAEAVGEEEPAEAVAEEQPAEAVAEEQPAEAVAGEQPAEAVAEEQPAEAVAEEQPAEAAAEEKPAQAVAEEQPAEAAAEEEPAQAVAEEEPAEAVAEEQPAEAAAEEEPAQAVAEEQPAEAVGEEEPAEAAAEEEPAEADAAAATDEAPKNG